MTAEASQQLTIAVAGGDATTRDWLLTTLRAAGHVAEHHATGSAAIAGLRKTPADLLVVCLDLERPPAATVVEEARKQLPDLGVLYVGNPNDEGVPWADVPAGGILLYGPSGPDLLPAVAVALTHARR